MHQSIEFDTVRLNSIIICLKNKHRNLVFSAIELQNGFYYKTTVKTGVVVS